MASKRGGANRELQNGIRRLSIINYVLIAVVIALLAFFVYQYEYSGTGAPAATTTVQGSQGSFGSTIAGINQPFNSTELSIINNAPNTYYEKAGEMLLNGTLSNQVYNAPVNKSYVPGTQVQTAIMYNGLILNGKPSVVYIGALSCIYCGENRWAMAMALSRFGTFNSLYYGYSAFGDGDLPTIYWEPYNYTTQSGVAYGNSYSSSYVNFISADYESPVTSGFQIKPMSYFVQNAPNSTYSTAMRFMNDSGLFEGTPFTLWGNVLMPGADAVVFGNSMPTNSTIPLTYMTHAQVLQQLHDFNNQFSYSEYAAADVYAAFLCAGTNNAAQFCSLPVMSELETVLGLS